MFKYILFKSFQSLRNLSRYWLIQVDCYRLNCICCILLFNGIDTNWTSIDIYDFLILIHLNDSEAGIRSLFLINNQSKVSLSVMSYSRRIKPGCSDKFVWRPINSHFFLSCHFCFQLNMCVNSLVCVTTDFW